MNEYTAHKSIDEPMPQRWQRRKPMPQPAPRTITREKIMDLAATVEIAKNQLAKAQAKGLVNYRLEASKNEHL